MRVLAALAVSALVHLLLAAGLGWCLATASAPDAPVRLDLSAVEMSLAEEDAETAAPAASPPAAAAAPDAPVPEMAKPPEPADVSPEPAMPALPEPAPAEPAPCDPALPEVSAPRQARVEAPPKPKSAIRPDYPRGSRRRKEEGAVVLEIRVSASGDASEVRVIGGSGFPELDAAAVKAAAAARFTPARSGRESVASVARLKIDFRLK